MAANNVLNTTPHAVNYYSKNEAGEFVMTQTFPKSAYVSRLGETAGSLDAFNRSGEFLQKYPHVAAPIYSGVEGLPPANEMNDKTVIVSMVVGNYLAANPNAISSTNTTFVGPDTGPQGVVRDDKGGILGTNRFVVYAQKN